MGEGLQGPVRLHSNAGVADWTPKRQSRIEVLGCSQRSVNQDVQGATLAANRRSQRLPQYKRRVHGRAAPEVGDDQT